MYLSCLLIDVGDNPDRPRPGGSGFATSTTFISVCAWHFRRLGGKQTIPTFLSLLTRPTLP